MSADNETPISGTIGSRLKRAGGDAAAIIAATREANEPQVLEQAEEKIYGVLVPEGSSFKTIDPYRLLEKPQRKEGTYKVATADALVAYVKEHEDADATTVWVHPTSGQVVAVLDDHKQGNTGDPGYRKHTVTLDLIVADEWKHWKSRDGRLVGQEEFAEHLEDGAPEIVRPDAATLLEIAQSFHASTNAEFRSGTRLASGEVKLVFEEDTQATAGRTGELEVPQDFDLQIRPFLGEDPVQVLARLRYRVNGGTLRIGYKLDRPEIIVRDVLDRVATRLSDDLANVYIGQPPA